MPYISFSVSGNTPPINIEVIKVSTSEVVSTKTIVDTASELEVESFTDVYVPYALVGTTDIYKIVATDAINRVVEYNNIIVNNGGGNYVNFSSEIIDSSSNNTMLVTLSGKVGAIVKINAYESLSGNTSGLDMWFTAPVMTHVTGATLNNTITSILYTFTSDTATLNIERMFNYNHVKSDIKLILTGQLKFEIVEVSGGDIIIGINNSKTTSWGLSELNSEQCHINYDKYGFAISGDIEEPIEGYKYAMYDSNNKSYTYSSLGPWINNIISLPINADINNSNNHILFYKQSDFNGGELQLINNLFISETNFMWLGGIQGSIIYSDHTVNIFPYLFTNNIDLSGTGYQKLTKTYPYGSETDWIITLDNINKQVAIQHVNNNSGSVVLNLLIGSRSIETNIAIHF